MQKQTRQRKCNWPALYLCIVQHRCLQQRRLNVYARTYTGYRLTGVDPVKPAIAWPSLWSLHNDRHYRYATPTDDLSCLPSAQWQRIGKMVFFSAVSVCRCVCFFCRHDNSWTVWDIIMKFQDMVRSSGISAKVAAFDELWRALMFDSYNKMIA